MLFLFYELPMLMLLPACLPYLLPQDRPRNFWPRYLLTATPIVLLCTGFFAWFITVPQHTVPDIVYWLLRPLLVLGIETILVRCSAGVPWPDAGYTGIFGFLTRELSTELCKALLRFLGTDGTYNDALFVPANILVPALIYIAVWFFIGQHLPEDGHLHCPKARWTQVLPLTFLVLIPAWLSQVVEGPSKAYDVLTIVQFIDLLFVLATLAGQHTSAKQISLEQELALQKRLWAQHERQLEMSKRNMELLNMKAHDIRHTIAALRTQGGGALQERVCDEVEASVRAFDVAVRTGNEILDAVLTEKSLTCQQSGITMACVADGSLLRDMDAVDLYVLLGNALDNAIESVLKLENPEQRLISVAVFQVKDMVKIQVENTCDVSIKLHGDLPPTTKPERLNHGYGLKSIKAAAERYGGILSVEAEDGQFTLHVLLPRAMMRTV